MLTKYYYHTKGNYSLVMSNIFSLLLVLGLFFGVLACSEKQGEETTTAIDLYEFEGFNMSSYDIPMLIMLPDETANIGASTTPNVIHIDGDFKWEINVGPNFTLVINDWGNRLTKVADEKKRLKDLKFFTIDYIKDEPNFIFYKKTLNAKAEKNKGVSVGTKHVSYHVYAQKQIEGINYVFESRADGYDKQISDLMVKSIQSITEITKQPS